MRIIGGLLAIAGVGVGAVVARRVASGAHETTSRWLAVTVNQETVDQLPEPLRRLGDEVEVRLRPAPGGRGTEILARPTRPVPAGGRLRASEDPRPAVRVALREAKSLLETGEVLRPSRPGSDRPTLPGRLLDVLIGRAQGEGRL